MKKTIIVTLIASLFVAGCASTAKDVPTSYVPTMAYQHLSCEQLNSEASRVYALLIENGGQLDKAAQNDVLISGVALFVFWPAIFFLGNKTQEAEYGKLKGMYDAVNRTAIEKKCTGVVPAHITAALNGPPSSSVTSKFHLPPSGFADIGNVRALPTQVNRTRVLYGDWLANPLPRAFVIAGDGSGYGAWTNTVRKDNSPSDPVERAIYRCENAGKTKCKLYAIDNEVVWVK